METYNPDFKSMRLLIWDGSGDNVAHAVRLAKDVAEVHYFTTWEEAACFRGYAIGMNMADNFHKVIDFFEPINDGIIDWVLFLDIGNGGACHFLRELGQLPVYGAGLGEKLERNRFETRKLEKLIGLPHPKGHKTWQVIGVKQLESFIEKNPDKYVKLDVFRGDKESFYAKDVRSIQGDLTELEAATGPLSEERPFMIEDRIEAKAETGLDAFFNGQEILRPFLVGIEHGIPYIGRSYETGPAFIEDFIKKITPTLQEKNHRGAISIEQKVINKHFAAPIDWTCFDEQTEILTDKGWKYFKDLDRSESVATLNRDNHNIEYQKPIGYIEKEYNGEMISIKGEKNFDLLVTPDHRMYIQRQSHKDFGFVEARDIKQGAKIPRTGKWKGVGNDTFIIPSITTKWHSGRGKGINKVAEHSEINIPMATWAKFLGIYLAEGCCKQKGQINIAQKTKVNEMKAILDNFPIKYSSYENGFQMSSVPLVRYLKQFGLCNEKYVPQEIKDAAPAIINAFLDAFCLGDGSIRENGARLFFTTSKQLADDLQELVLKVGNLAIVSRRNSTGTMMQARGKKYTRNHDIYLVRESLCQIDFNIDNSRYKHITRENYVGNVYCVSVPNEIIYVRRNGKPTWAGNCRFPAPLGIVYTAWVKNYTPVMWACTNSLPIKVESASKYVIAVNIKCSHAQDNWLALDLQEKDRNKIKLWGCCRDEEGYYHIVQGSSGGIYIVILGNNLDKMLVDVEETAKKVDGRDIDKSPIYELYKIMDDIKELRKMGIDF